MTFWEATLDVLISLIPPALVGIIFWIMLRSILRVDRGERDTYSRIEAEEREKRANALGEQP
jgi:hypothetical protein